MPVRLQGAGRLLLLAAAELFDPAEERTIIITRALGILVFLVSAVLLVLAVVDAYTG